MRHLFIINPVAGRKGSTQALLDRLDQVSFSHERVFTEGEGHAQELARQAAQAGEPVRIWACGGDGTLNEVVNGAAGFDNAAITCVPKGTGNDFLKVFGPNYRDLFYDLEAMAAGPQTTLDLMDCNGKLGLDVVCGGVDARIAAGVHRYKDLPFVTGKGAYILSLIENIFLKGICRPMEVQMGPVHYSGPTAIVCVCNGRYYGGGFNPVPDAEPDDGFLDVLLVAPVSRLTVATVIGHYKRGEYRRFPHLIRHFQCQSVRIWCQAPSSVNLDGELRTQKEVCFQLVPQKIRFFYPSGLTYRAKHPLKQV